MVAWMFNSREVHGKPRLHVCQAIVWIIFAILRDPVVPAASHDNHQLMGFLLFPIWVWGSACDGPPELPYELDISI